ncbi:MAG: GTPase ObgE [Myxococcales bacterium]|nr:GTPase ObgE [Myxococcales bacterium]
MHFIDEAEISVRAGSGGRGCVSFRREKHVPRGGPDGGDGGRGGNVFVVADAGARSLYDYHVNRTYAAEDGRAGGGSNCTGRNGADLTLPVPPGTQISDRDTGEALADLTVNGARVTLVSGGNGGWGNSRFATATRQAPDKANPGLAGRERRVRLELKLLADVALVGWPNVGKSSLIRAVSASRARVADYPFTTLVPNLGVVRHRSRSFTIADIPGLIEGASQGAGLGLRFLRHVERCRLLVFLLSPVDGPPPAEALAVLRRELAQYDASLASRPCLIRLVKSDVLGDQADAAARELGATLGEPVRSLSAATKAGVTGLLDDLCRLLGPTREPAGDPVALP